MQKRLLMTRILGIFFQPSFAQKATQQVQVLIWNHYLFCWRTLLNTSRWKQFHGEWVLKAQWYEQDGPHHVCIPPQNVAQTNSPLLLAQKSVRK